MLIVERHKQLMNILRERQSEQLETLAEQVGVSVSTVRRDLEELEKQGRVQRTHGGAIYKSRGKKPSIEMSSRMQLMIDEKKSIGRYAGSMVEPGMTVLLDGGSTVYYAAQLIDARPIQVVTNSLSIASLFSNDERVELLIIGGNLYPRSEAMVGPIAMRALADINADVLFFSLSGIFDNDAYNLNFAMAEVENRMMQQAAKSVMLMDSSKFGRKSLARVCGLNEVDYVVTDAGIEVEWVNALEEKLLIAPSDEMLGE